MTNEVRVQSCAVCGLASHRDEWKNALKGAFSGLIYVACDLHSKEELASAVALAEGKLKAATQKPSAPAQVVKPAASAKTEAPTK